MKRACIVQGFGFGDEGKGTITHWLTVKHRAHTVVRTGGPQAFHRVVTARGKAHVFSQFGSGTLAGATTHLSRHMVVDPDAILREGEALKYEQGIRNILDLITIHRDALVITPFQAIANRLREMVRGDDRHGTVGIGVGEAVLDAKVLGSAAVISAGDLNKPSALAVKLEVIRQCKLIDLAEVIEQAKKLTGHIGELAAREIEQFMNPETVAWTMERFALAAKNIKIVDDEYLANQILGRDGTVVFEGSQGVLLDPWCGFHPHITKVRTIPETAHQLIRMSGYGGEVQTFGVIRAYHTRHGAGPFVSHCPTMSKDLPDAANKEHPWQGSFRVGPLDLVALRYAVNVCGGPQALTGLAVTCLDRILPFGEWPLCDSYRYTASHSHRDLFAAGEMVASYGEDEERLIHQEKLTEALGCVEPEITKTPIMGLDQFTTLCRQTIAEKVGVPVVTVSLGPTEADKQDY